MSDPPALRKGWLVLPKKERHSKARGRGRSHLDQLELKCLRPSFEKNHKPKGTPPSRRGDTCRTHQKGKRGREKEARDRGG